MAWLDGASAISRAKARRGPSPGCWALGYPADFRGREPDAVIGIRYDATEVMQGVTEVICYGTAVQVAG